MLIKDTKRVIKIKYKTRDILGIIIVKKFVFELCSQKK